MPKIQKPETKPGLKMPKKKMIAIIAIVVVVIIVGSLMFTKKSDDTTNLSQENIQQLESLVLNTIKNYSVDTVYFKDRNSKFLWNSKGHSNQVGEKDPADMRGKSDFDYFPEEFAQIALEVEKKIMETGEPVNDANEVWYKSDDEIVYLMSSKYPLYDEDGEIVEIPAVSDERTIQRDLTFTLEQ